MAVRGAAYLPRAMTFDGPLLDRMDGDAGEPMGYGVIMGLPLTHQMVRHLDLALRGLAAQERLEQLSDISEPLYRVYKLHLAGRTAQQIAESVGVSPRLIRDYVRRAQRFVGGNPNHDQHLSEQQRLALLEVEDTLAHTVWVMSAYGWRQDRQAELLGVSVDTVQRRLKKASAFVGSQPRVRLARQYRTRRADQPEAVA